MLIDWVQATRGNPLADVAAAGAPVALRRATAWHCGALAALESGRAVFWREYRRSYLRLRRSDAGELARWELPVAVAFAGRREGRMQAQLLGRIATADGGRALKHVSMHTGAWNGDRQVSLSFPDAWDVQVVGESAGPALDADAMRSRLRSPIGAPRLSELARGCRNAAIIIDDISRPTPTADILPLVLEELEAGGMPLAKVKVVIAAGGHEAAPERESLMKVGAETARRVAWELHDPDGDLVSAGKSPSHIPLFINRSVMSADLKIGIGGITPHDGAGFSGGSKILVPGVAGTQTARYLHDFLKGAKQRGASIDNDFRRELDVITGRLGLNFIVNVVLNHERRVAAPVRGRPGRSPPRGSRVRLAQDSS